MKKPKLAVIGAGVSGLSVAHLLEDRFELTVLEREDAPGGLIRCKCVDGCLFHKCGGHVFNTNYEDVFEWVKHFVDFDKDFIKADRNACIVFENGRQIPYPIENHIYYLDKDLQQQCIQDFLHIASSGEQTFWQDVVRLLFLLL